MSHISRAPPEFDFWGFVHCSKCHSSFISSSGGLPSVPFWLTECGHVICNNHLNTDQSCAECGEQGIQLIPLQREMDAPMSDWFRSVPQAFDTVAYAAKFQMETMASLVRYYREKYTTHRALIERLRDEHNEIKVLKKTVNELRAENAQLRQYIGYSQEMPPEINEDGKRPRLGSHRDVSGSRTNSSPRSVVTPLGPNRLTLPPDRQQPNFSQPSQEENDFSHNQAMRSSRHAETYPQQSDRPGSSRFIQQYAYVPPHTPQSQGIPPLTLSHSQAAPARQAAARQSQIQTHQSRSSQAHTSTLPPAESSRELRPMPSAPPPPMDQTVHRTRSQVQMPPPPTPQLRRGAVPPRDSLRPPATAQLPSSSSSSSQLFMSATPSRSSGSALPASNRFVPPLRTSQTQRFFLSSGQSAGSERLRGSQSCPSELLAEPMAGSISRAPSTSGSGGQRVPFMPRNSNN